MGQTIEEYKTEGRACKAELASIFSLPTAQVTDEQAERVQYIKEKFGEIPEVKKMFDDNYDARMTNKGFGSRNCTCHISPPCSSCISYSQAEGCVEENGCEDCKKYVEDDQNGDEPYWECEITEEP
jgi:hypothetical protein